MSFCIEFYVDFCVDSCIEAPSSFCDNAFRIASTKLLIASNDTHHQMRVCKHWLITQLEQSRSVTVVIAARRRHSRAISLSYRAVGTSGCRECVCVSECMSVCECHNDQANTTVSRVVALCVMSTGRQLKTAQDISRLRVYCGYYAESVLLNEREIRRSVAKGVSWRARGVFMPRS